MNIEVTFVFNFKTFIFASEFVSWTRFDLFIGIIQLFSINYFRNFFLMGGVDWD